MNPKEIQAIITLLDDPDNEIYDAIFHSLLEKGLDIIPELEKAWEVSANSLTQDRIENIIHKIQLNFVHNSLNNWVRDGGNNLLEGAYIIARYQYPELGFFEIQNPIEKIKHDTWLELNENLTALEKVKILNHIIFDIHKFVGNTNNYYSPQNSFINQVLLSKKGNPISLGIIYASVAQKLGLPIYGVNLPKNFILAYKDEFYELLNPDAPIHENILFYINPFNHGAVLGRKEIDFFLKQQNITPDDTYYQPCNNLEIIQRLLLNLIYSYEKLGYNDKIKDLQDLLKISRLKA
jgi:regulator of sirC expression with transglutaminase-like and TPR domain